MSLKKGIWIERDADIGIILEKNWVIDEAQNYLKNNASVENLTSNVNYLWGQKILYGDYKKVPFVILCAQGTPCSINAIERMLRTGVNSLVAVGTCGSTDESVNRGSYILTTGCVRDENVSQGYLDSRVSIMSNQNLTLQLASTLRDLNIDAKLGMTFTTDLRYKENAETLKKLYKQSNVLNIDMETSAILAVAQYHNLKAAALNIVTDCATVHSTEEFKGVFDGSENYYNFIMPQLIKGIDASLNALVKQE